MKTRYLIDRPSRNLIFVLALASFAVLAAIAVFTLKEALPALKQVGLLDFLFRTEWRPTDGQFGILPMILGTVMVTIGAVIFAVPLGVGCAVPLAEVAPPRIRQFLRAAVELLVGIPSVV